MDNDLAGTDATIGFDTAVNTAVEVIDLIRDTATARERTFVVQVMGRDARFIALATGMACGAETILVPEIPWSEEGVRLRLRRGSERGPRQNVIVMAEVPETRCGWEPASNRTCSWRPGSRFWATFSAVASPRPWIATWPAA